MSIHCECGYQADSPEDLTDHMTEMFTPQDDRGPDGQVHAEAALGARGSDGNLACLCGFTGPASALDEHFIRVFAPADRTGRDGRKHLTVRAAPQPSSADEAPGRRAGR